MRWAPMANDKVTVGSRPSGTSATVTPMANTRASDISIPISAAITAKNPPTPTAIADTLRTRRCSSISRGLSGLSEPDVSEAIVASRVWPPVADTTASTSPVTTKLPASTTDSGAIGSGTLSPVSIEVSTVAAPERITSASAGMRSPAESTSRSPTTI